MARSFAQLESLVRLSNTKGIDVRPMLLRVLTDLYVQEHSHSREREQQFCELALRLLPAVDVQTRVAVAAKLARYPAAPSAVVERLAADVPDVAGALEPRPGPSEVVWSGEPHQGEGRTSASIAPVDTPRQAYLPTQDGTAPASPPLLRPALGESFLAGDSTARLALLKEVEEELPREGAAAAPVTRPGAVERLEKTALAGDAAEFARELYQSFALAPRLGTRIAGDEGGEALVVLAHAIAMPRAVLVRVLLFLNPSIGQSVERVFSLVRLYETMSTAAARQLFALWREGSLARAGVAHQLVHAPGIAPALTGLLSNARRAVDTPAEADRRASPPRDRRQGTS